MKKDLKDFKKFECRGECKQIIHSVSSACLKCIKRYMYPITKDQAEKIEKIIFKR